MHACASRSSLGHSGCLGQTRNLRARYPDESVFGIYVRAGIRSCGGFGDYRGLESAELRSEGCVLIEEVQIVF
jgi:hypothetical protein